MFSTAPGHHPPSAPPLLPGLLTVIIPAFNERPTLLEALDEVRAVPVHKEIVIIDDASTDGTRELLRTCVEGRYPEVTVLYLPRNSGKGMAIRAALLHVRGEYVIIQDADLECVPQEYPALLRPLVEEGATVVYGSRFLRERPRIPLPNLLINWLLARMVRHLYGFPLSDEATAYKLFRTQVLRSVPLTCQRFEFCPEVTAKLLRRGHRIVEVPISYRPRTKSQGKKVRAWAGVVAVWTLLKFRLWRG
ncbi:MAG: glycosyltransferase family 2 protein [Armatimonadetes bacterium]|nr:glycosyltransferase family 2 protein [Armatimonadota bacterium]